MQQTDKYKLNLIENSDTFSPDPLNDNMEKVEAAFQAASDARAAESAARKDADTALSKRVTALELRKLICGSYTGNGKLEDRMIQLPFTPIAVLICSVDTKIAVREMVIAEQFSQPTSASPTCKIVDGGFMIYFYGNAYNYPSTLNYANYIYNYIAFC